MFMLAGVWGIQEPILRNEDFDFQTRLTYSTIVACGFGNTGALHAVIDCCSRHATR
jgi:hypothetical protein